MRTVKRLLTGLAVGASLLAILFGQFPVMPVAANAANIPILYEHLNTGGDGDSGVIYSANWTAQQFTSDNVSHLVTSVRVPLKRVGTYPYDVTLSITYADSDNLSTGADLTTAALNGNAMTTSYVWYDFDVEDMTLDYATKYAIVVRATSGNATDYILWQKDSGGGLADAVGSHSHNSGVTWTSDSPADYLFEIWGTTAIEIEDAQVFSGYIETGDWLITIAYKNTFEPYYPTEGVRSYFYLQLVDNVTVKAQVNCPMWGYRVGSIYIGKGFADTLDWGNANYKVRLVGDFGGNPYTDYTLTALDWIGGDLTFLDKWVLAQANSIAEYDEVPLTVYIADRGEVLNATGHTIFTIGIPGLNEVRPDLFLMTVLTPEHEEEEWEHPMQETTDWEAKLGTTVSGTLTDWGNIISVSGKDIGGFLVFVTFIGIMAVMAFAGHLIFGLALSYSVLLTGAWFGVVDYVLLGVVTLLAAVIFVYKVWFTK